MTKTYTLRITQKEKEILDKIAKKGETQEKTIKRLLRALETEEEAWDFVEGLTWGLVKRN